MSSEGAITQSYDVRPRGRQNHLPSSTLMKDDTHVGRFLSAYTYSAEIRIVVGCQLINRPFKQGSFLKGTAQPPRAGPYSP